MDTIDELIAGYHEALADSVRLTREGRSELALSFLDACREMRAGIAMLRTLTPETRQLRNGTTLDTDRVVSTVRKIGGSRGATAREVVQSCRMFAKASPEERQELLDSAVEAGLLLPIAHSRTVRYIAGDVEEGGIK